MKNIVAVALVACLFLGACSTPEVPTKLMRDTTQAAQVAGSYLGMIPCADCEEISYRLLLGKDFTYRDRRVYKGKSVDPVEASGAYGFTSDGIIVLEKPEPGYTHFRRHPKGLLMLDREGQEITGALADRYVLPRMERGSERVAEGEPSDLQARLAREGIDFYARGNEPSWALDMDLDKVTRFNTVGGLRFVAPAVEGVRAQDADVLRFHTVAEAGTLTITLMGEKCVDTMSGKEFTHRVRIGVRASGDAEIQTFEGCGRYIPDPRLGKPWILRELDGEPVSGKGLTKGEPRLDFLVDEGRIAGHGGCNSITGIYVNEWKYVRFGQIASTLMACPDMAVEQRFLTAISGKLFRYALMDQFLILSRPDGTTLRFEAGE